DVGEIDMETIGVALTATVVLAVVEPPLLVAVRVYVVVAEGVTVVDVPVTVPIPGAMLMVSAPVTLQLSVALCPVCTAAGVAVKAAITGEAGVPLPLPNLPN